jgi:hypothetical protein
MDERQRVTVLGATGSIGENTLDVIARHAGRYRVFALSCGSRWRELLAQCRVHAPDYAVVADPAAATELRAAVRAENLAGRGAGRRPRVWSRVAAHPDVDIVMAAIVGAAGLARRWRRVGRQARAAGQQGSAGDGRAAADACGGRRRRDAHARSTASTMPSSSACPRLSRRGQHLGASRGEAHPAHRLRRPVLEDPAPTSSGVTPEQAVCPSQLGHGAQDLGRFGHHDEQGAGADRGLLAVRRAARHGGDRGPSRRA